MKKTIDDYAATILLRHVELQLLPPQHPDYEKTEDQLSRQLTAWSKKLDFNVRVAQNEQQPWTDEELGLVTIPMEKKAASGYNQTGDYIFEILNDDQSITTGGLVVERKTLQDIYNTLMNREQRSRLYREITRYETDPRFNRFHLIAECTYEEFLEYVPEIFVFTHGSAHDTIRKNIIQYLSRFYKIKVLPRHIQRAGSGTICIATDDHQVVIMLQNGGAEVFIDGVLRETLVKNINQYGKVQYFVRRGASEASKIETINSLENRIQVSFVGSRSRAVEKYGGLVRQWCRTHYKQILNID
ncbi:MAG: hypothetical protein KAS66_05605 [Candidatus Omnitrophica bacterium]|nr:hypothetical protein [Candidatus Omnitrophota bacterium]